MTSTAKSPATVAGGPRRAAHPNLVLMVIACTQLIVVLDATIVNIALPTMGQYFKRNQTDMTWALNAYTLAFGGLLLLGGRSGDLLGRRRMFIVGLTLFTTGSFLAGIAPSFQFLLFGRVVQGIGGAIASPTALSLITTSFREGAERTKAFAVYAAVSGAGAALGLLLGGVLTEWFSWRWVLFVNVPIGAVLIAGAFMYLTESERQRGSFDFAGAVTSTLGMTALVYGFIHVAREGWNNPETYFEFAAAVILLTSFVVLEAFVIKHPMMPMRIFENRSRSGAYIVMGIVGASMFGMFYFITFYVQNVKHFSALRTGVAFLPVAFMIGITSQLMTKLLPRYGPKPIIVAGTIFLTAAMLDYSTLDTNSSYWLHLFPAFLVQAIGMGCIFVPITSVAVSRIANTDAGIASALLNVGQQVGGAIGLSVLATVFATAARNSATDQVAQLVQNGDPVVLRHFAELAGASQSGVKPSGEALSDVVARHAADAVQAHAAGQAFFAAAMFGIVAIIVALLVINVRKEDIPAHSELPEAVGAH